MKKGMERQWVGWAWLTLPARTFAHSVTNAEGIHQSQLRVLYCQEWPQNTAQGRDGAVMRHGVGGGPCLAPRWNSVPSIKIWSRKGACSTQQPQRVTRGLSNSWGCPAAFLWQVYPHLQQTRDSLTRTLASWEDHLSVCVSDNCYQLKVWTEGAPQPIPT